MDQGVRNLAWTLLLASSLLSACRSNKRTGELAPVKAPDLEYATRQFIGSALSGPSMERTLPAGLEASDALAVHCTLTYHETMPRFDLPPLGTQARMIGAMRGEEAILPNTVFTTTVQYVRADVAEEILSKLETATAERSVNLQEYEGALFPGTCVVFVGQSLEAIELPLDGEAYRRLALVLSRSAEDKLDFGVVIDQLAQFEGNQREGEDLDPYQIEREERILQREFLLIDTPPVIGGGPIAMLIPSPIPGFAGGGFSAVIEVDEAPTSGPAFEAHRAVVERCVAEIANERAVALEAARRLRDAELEVREIGEALRSLQLDRLQRKTLVFLTTTTGALLAEDLALIIDEETLRVFAEAIVSGAERTDTPLGESGGLGWILERGAYQFLVDRLSEGSIASSELGLLLKHTGEAGQFPAVIEDALAIAPNQEDFLARIVLENRIFLEDHSIASRVRAYDWLDARGLAPNDYDPLGDAASRRSALAADQAHRAELEHERQLLEAKQ